MAVFELCFTDLSHHVLTGLDARLHIPLCSFAAGRCIQGWLVSLIVPKAVGVRERFSIFVT